MDVFPAHRQEMSAGPAHARQRRRRLLVLVSTLLLVSAFSPRVQENFGPAEASLADSAVVNTEPLAQAVTIATPWSVSRGDATRGTDLFTFVPAPIEAAALEAQAPAPAQEIHYVELNDALLAGKQSIFWAPGRRLTVPLPGGGWVEIEIETTEATGPDAFTSTGHIVGVPEGRAMFSYYQGRFSARFENLPQGDLQLRSLTPSPGKNVSQLYVVDPTLIPNCGGDLEMEINHDSPIQLVGGGAGKTPAPAPVMVSDEVEDLPAASLESGQAVVDVLIAYTRAVRLAYGSEAAVQAEIRLGMAKVNSDFAHSGITARVRLAGTIEVDYPEDHLNGQDGDRYQATTLGRLRDPRDGYLDEVHTKREEVGADLVSLLVQRRDNDSAGIAYLLTEPHGYVGPLFAFSVVHAPLVSGAQAVLSHELGHNFGCAHARGDAGAKGTQDGAYAFSYGYRFNAVTTGGQTRELRTLMAYQPGDRIPYFSNPRLTLPSGASFNGSTYQIEPEPALGRAEGSALAADNARTIEQTAFQVSSYRVAPDFSDAGTLINVSTLARVGTGDEVMIGGFVVQGSEPKRVLLRAAGPALAPYGVPSVLVDPQLDLYAGPSRLRGNDDWWRGTDPAAFTDVFDSVGALPNFPAGSLDAALVAELDPGAYTAIVSGKAGRTGQALIEAYELNSGGGRIVNLSTRAYASSRSEPIVAGFVVRSDPSQPAARKRMFLRVLGPSLGTEYKVNGAMADPLMELYDAKGDLVLSVDDWDPPTTTFTGVAGAVVTRGQVDQVSEQEVFEANRSLGGHPLQPVEPAVVVEVLKALKELRGAQRVTTDNPEATYQALEKYGIDLVDQARRARWIR
jgi:hypothetical protein